MAYQQRGEVKLAENEVVARVRFEVALAVRRLLDDVIPELQAHFDQQIHAGVVGGSIEVSSAEVQEELAKVFIKRLGKEVPRARLPQGKR